MNQKVEKERPFEKLKKRDGTLFDETTVKNWYIARAYVLNKLNDVISPVSNKYLKIIVEIDDYEELMLAVVRQVALVAHYPNYVEYDKFGVLSQKNRSVVTIVSRDESIVEKLKQEEYLNNVFRYCKYRVNGQLITPHSNDIPIDIDFNIVDSVSDEEKKDAIVMSYSSVNEFWCSNDEADIIGIDTRMAVLAGRVYDRSVEIDNLPYEDIHNIVRYNRALSVFQYKLLPKKIEKMVKDKWEDNQVKNGLSNIFCADRFRLIAAGIKEFYEKKRKDFCEECQKNIGEKCKRENKENCKRNEVDEVSCWEQNGFKLAVSEHSRWVVEKLILGFRPMNTKERVRYGNLFGDQRKEYKSLLKGNPKELQKRFQEDYEEEVIDPTHLNLCTFKELRRIDPDNRKYDSFLMLAIPLIINKINEDDGK